MFMSFSCNPLLFSLLLSSHGKLFKTPIKIRPVSGANATTVSSGGPVSTNSDLQESVKSN